METIAPERTLTALDRCDRCGAGAVVRADHDKWSAPLLFCGHHYREHEASLAALGAFVVDERPE